MSRENARLTFITERDGLAAAIDFARRGIKLYRSFSMKAHIHRAKMIDSCIRYHNFIKHNGG